MSRHTHPNVITKQYKDTDTDTDADTNANEQNEWKKSIIILIQKQQKGKETKSEITLTMQRPRPAHSAHHKLHTYSIPRISKKNRHKHTYSKGSHYVNMCVCGVVREKEKRKNTAPNYIIIIFKMLPTDLPPATPPFPVEAAK